MGSTTKKNLLGSTGLALCLGTASIARAQAPADTAAAAPDALETVVVTAQKRSQDIQKTAIALVAISGADLDQKGYSNLIDIVTTAPSVSVYIQNNGYFIRGIGNSNGSPFATIFQDGIVIASPSDNNFDVARVEVLNGPQGTLYGRNTISGAVNIITNDPTDKYAGDGTVTFGNYNLLKTGGMINIPFDDTIQARMAWSTEKHSGYITDGQDDANFQTFRLKFLIKPDEDLTVHVWGDWLTTAGKGISGDEQVLALSEHPKNPWQGPNVSNLGIFGGNTVTTTGPTNFCAVIPFSGGIGAGNTQSTAINTTPLCDWFNSNGWNWHFNTSVDDDLGFAAFTGIYGHEDTRSGGGYGLAINNLQGGGTTSHATQDSLEMRLASEADSSIKWVGGLYWQENLTGDGLGTGMIKSGVEATGITDTSTKAAFGQVTYPITDSLRITGGLRYNHDYQHNHSANLPLTGATYIIPTGEGITTENLAYTAVPTISVATWNKLTWKVGGEYDVTPDSLAYFTASTGYVAGVLSTQNFCTNPAFPDGGMLAAPGCYSTTNTALQNTTTGGVSRDVAGVAVYAPVALIAYEIGNKNRFMDDRLQFNWDVYYMKFTNFTQAGFGLDATGAAVSQTVEIHGTKAMGVEAQAAYRITPVDRIDVNVTWEHAIVGDPNNPFSNPASLVAGFQTCTGIDPLGITVPYGCHGPVTSNTALPFSPTWSGNIEYVHTFNLPSGSSVTADVREHLETGSWTLFSDEPDSWNPAYHMTNLSVTYDSADGKYSISAWARNLEDHAVVGTGEDSSAGKSIATCTPSNAVTTISCGGAPDLISVGPPRTFGLTLTARF